MKDILDKFALLMIIIIMVGSCREPTDNANSSGDGIEQEWKEDESKESQQNNDTIIRQDTEKNGHDEKDRSIKP